MSTTARSALGERWTICTLDHVHWGANGGAGLLLRHTPAEGEPRYLLALRSRSVDEPATWGVPGGAIRDGETPEAAARRETVEEIGQLPAYRVTGEVVQDCGGGWRFHLILADTDKLFDAYTHHETDATGWFTRAQMLALPLHPGVRTMARRGRGNRSAGSASHLPVKERAARGNRVVGRQQSHGRGVVQPPGASVAAATSPGLGAGRDEIMPRFRPAPPRWLPGHPPARVCRLRRTRRRATTDPRRKTAVALPLPGPRGPDLVEQFLVQIGLALGLPGLVARRAVARRCRRPGAAAPSRRARLHSHPGQSGRTHQHPIAPAVASSLIRLLPAHRRAPLRRSSAHPGLPNANALAIEPRRAPVTVLVEANSGRAAL